MDAAARLLQMLTLLQTRASWTAEALAERLGVTPRTVRRDVERLRRLGYPMAAVPGRHGGYRLEEGRALPPLSLTDEEAVAVAVGVRGAATSGVEGLGDAAAATLAKLEQLLPARLRPRVAALSAATEPLVRLPGETVDAEVLAALAAACRQQEQVRIGYRDRRGQASHRDIEPLRLVQTGCRWYLVAWDRSRDDWRTFRVDRVTDAQPSGVRFRHDDPPDAAALVAQSVAFGPYEHLATAYLEIPVETAASLVPPTIGTVEPEGQGTRLRLGTDDADWTATYLVGLGVPFSEVEPAEVRAALGRLGERLAAAYGGRER